MLSECYRFLKWKCTYDVTCRNSLSLRSSSSLVNRKYRLLNLYKVLDGTVFLWENGLIVIRCMKHLVFAGRLYKVTSRAQLAVSPQNVGTQEIYIPHLSIHKEISTNREGKCFISRARCDRCISLIK
jgi:hypothetical protein